MPCLPLLCRYSYSNIPRHSYDVCLACPFGQKAAQVWTDYALCADILSWPTHTPNTHAEGTLIAEGYGVPKHRITIVQTVSTGGSPLQMQNSYKEIRPEGCHPHVVT